jgi:hypothetical protein
MQPVNRRRSFAPVLNPLEGRVVPSGVAFAASHAAVLVKPLAKPGPALRGSVSGSLNDYAEMIFFVGNITSGSLQKYGTVTGQVFFTANNPGTIVGSAFLLFHGRGRHNRLELDSKQSFSLPSAGETQVQLTFKVQSASGGFASLRHKTVKADVQLNVSAGTTSATFP